MVWLRFAVPIPEAVVDSWDTASAAEHWDLRQQVRQAAEDTLDKMMGRPKPIVDDHS
jgi:hypothetical protein